MKAIKDVLRFTVALVMVAFCHLFGIPVGLSGQRALARAVKAARRTARPARYEGQVNLARARAWYAVSKVSSLNSLFNTIYEDALFVARDTALMASLVTPYSAQGYMNRVLSTYPQITAQDVAEGVDYSNATEWTKTASVTLTPGEKMAQAVLTDARQQTDPENARTTVSRELGLAIAEKIDTDLLGDFASFTTDKGTANTSLTIAISAAALAKLRNNKARGPFSFVLHPYGWHDIWVELGQPAATQSMLGDVANEALREYFVGRFLAANWYTSANISVDGSADAISAVFSRDALALDTREAPTLEPERDASLRAWELNMHAGYAHGVIRADHGIKLTHDATEPT